MLARFHSKVKESELKESKLKEEEVRRMPEGTIVLFVPTYRSLYHISTISLRTCRVLVHTGDLSTI